MNKEYYIERGCSVTDIVDYCLKRKKSLAIWGKVLDNQFISGDWVLDVPIVGKDLPTVLILDGTNKIWTSKRVPDLYPKRVPYMSCPGTLVTDVVRTHIRRDKTEGWVPELLYDQRVDLYYIHKSDMVMPSKSVEDVCNIAPATELLALIPGIYVNSATEDINIRAIEAAISYLKEI